MSVIEVSGLTKYYGKSRGVVDVTLMLKKVKFLVSLGQMAQVNPPLSGCCFR